MNAPKLISNIFSEDKRSAQKGQKTQLKELSSEDLTTDDISFEEEIPDDISFEDLELPDDTSFEEEMPVSYEQVEDNLIVDRGDNYKGKNSLLFLKSCFLVWKY